VRRRKGERITTTGQLVSLICGAVGRPGQKRRVGKHPARRTFQALRIAVNRELENLERLLFSAPDLLGKDGYLAVISYHSLEDRLVKQDFKRNAERGVYRILTKKPLGPSSGEIAENWRARSAKLRIAQRA
jgi:16S rRNA (cytosine1402-N4)-methyltransferase